MKEHFVSLQKNRHYQIAFSCNWYIFLYFQIVIFKWRSKNDNFTWSAEALSQVTDLYSNKFIQNRQLIYAKGFVSCYHNKKKHVHFKAGTKVHVLQIYSATGHTWLFHLIWFILSLNSIPSTSPQFKDLYPTYCEWSHAITIYKNKLPIKTPTCLTEMLFSWSPSIF